MCVFAEYRLSIRPRATRFTKPLGSSIVLTCEVRSTTADDVRVTSLQWLDEKRTAIAETPGRSVNNNNNNNNSTAIYTAP